MSFLYASHCYVGSFHVLNSHNNHVKDLFKNLILTEEIEAQSS